MFQENHGKSSVKLLMKAVNRKDEKRWFLLGTTTEGEPLKMDKTTVKGGEVQTLTYEIDDSTFKSYSLSFSL